MPPTAILHLTFCTIETTTLKEVLVGFSFFPLFIDPDTQMPVLNKNYENRPSKKVSLHKGCYQMPIYNEYPPQTNTLTYENFLNLERIPTASVLLRVTLASIDDDGEFITIKDPDPKKAAMAYEQPPDYNN